MLHVEIEKFPTTPPETLRCTGEFDKEITIFNSLPVDKDDINYKLCVKSTRIETDDHFLETDDLKKGAATKVLFV